MNSPENQAELPPARINKKSFLCRIILSMALTYFLILALLFLAGLIFSGKIIETIKPYYEPGSGDPVHFRWFALACMVSYFTAVAGIVLFILKHKIGFFIFFTASIVIFALDLSFLNFDWLRYLIHTGFIFVLGIAHFSKKCYN